MHSWLLCGLLSTSSAVAATPTVTVRSAPIYAIDGSLVNMGFVINLRDAAGEAVTTVPFQGVISGPWGTNGISTVKPLKNGFVFLTGPGRYIPGQYRFKGLVGEQPVTQNITVPQVKTTIEAQTGSLSAWLNRNSTATKIWFQPTTPETKKNYMLGWLLFEEDENNIYRQYWHGTGGRAEYTVPDQVAHLRTWVDLYQFNVPSPIAPKNDAMQGIVIYRLRSEWLNLTRLPPQKWWNVLEKTR